MANSNIVVIRSSKIDRKIKQYSEMLYGKDRDIIYSNALTNEFLEGLGKEGNLDYSEDEDRIRILFENENWFKGVKSVTVYNKKEGKRAKSKRLAVVALCRLIFDGVKKLPLSGDGRIPDGV